MSAKKWINRFQESQGRLPWALVTGGSSGMGLEYARQLAEIGCNLLLVSNQEEELQKAAEELRQSRTIQVIPHYQNLATETAAEELLAYCQSEGLQIDILINNAGMFFFEELTTENDARTRQWLHRQHVVDGRDLALSGHHDLLGHQGLSEEFQQVALFRDEALWRGRDHGLPSRHCHAALQVKTQFVEVWRENWIDWYTSMVGTEGIEGHDEEKKGSETRLDESLSAAFDRHSTPRISE